MSAIPFSEPLSFPDTEIEDMPPTRAERVERLEMRREFREWVTFIFVCAGVANYLVLGWHGRMTGPEAISAEDRSFKMARESAELSASAARASADAVKALADALHKP